MKDLISIITPTYNCAKFIGVTIESVMKQTYENWEMIIVDDASTDNTEEIVRRYDDKRIKLICFSSLFSFHISSLSKKAMYFP